MIMPSASVFALPAPSLKSYVEPFANGARNGRVAAPARSLTRIRAVTALTPPLDNRSKRARLPEWVVVPESGEQVVVGYGNGYPFEAFRTAGQRIPVPAAMFQFPGEAGYPFEVLQGLGGMYSGSAARIAWDAMIATDARFSTWGFEMSWTGEVAAVRPPIDGALLAARVTDEAFLSIVQAPPTGNGESADYTPHRVHASLHRRSGAGEWLRVWHEEVDGVGTGAIGAQGQAALATDSGRFLVLGPDSDAQARPVRHADVSTPFAPYYMSAIGNRLVLVEPVRTWLPKPRTEPWTEGSGDARDAWQKEQSLRRELYLAPGSSALSWRSGIVALEDGGQLAWRAEAAFRVLAPPIDAADGRVAVVGEGLGMLEGGAWKWSQSSPIRLLATAYEDGTLVVVAGSEVWVVARDGRRVSALAVPDGRPATAPPAIAANGSVWLATESALWVAE